MSASGPQKFTYSGLEDVFGSITVGEQVEVFEDEANLVGQGEVIRIDRERALVFLSVTWSSLRRPSSDERRWP